MHAQPDHLSDFTTDRRVLLLSLLAVAVGVFGALVARALVWLIAVITNLAYFQRFSWAPLSPSENHLGPRHEIGRLPIVSREDPARLVGYLGRAGVMAARVRLFEEEHVRERGRDREDEPVSARPSS